MNVTIRAATPEDAGGIRGLFAEIFGRVMTPEEWEWKYAGNPDGWAAVVAQDRGGRIVGHYGAWLMRAEIGGRQYLVASIGDMMTSPAARRALGHDSVFVRMGKAIFEILKAGGVPFVFGFPSPRAMEIGRRFLGFESNFPVRKWLYPAGGNGTALPVRRVARVEGSFDDLWTRYQEILPPSYVVHDSSRVNHRFSGRPDRSYQMVELPGSEGLLGWGVLARTGPRALVMDFAVAPPAAVSFPLLWEALRAEALAMGFGEMAVWESPAPLMRHLPPPVELVEAGFSFATVPFDAPVTQAFLADLHLTASMHDDR